MSQLNADFASQDAFKLLQLSFIEDTITAGSIALSLYEYLTTMDQEIELVWKRKTRFSLPSILLVSTRICMIINPILAVAASPSTCTGLKVFIILQQLMDTAGYIQVALFSALRVSALYNRNIILFAAVLVLGLGPMGPNLFGLARTVYLQGPGVCLQDSSISDTLAQKLVLVSRIPVIIADFLVLTLTWAKTYNQILLSRGSGISTILSTCLARDGAVYFLVLLTINILQIATYQTHLGAPVGIILATLPPVLINRFMFNLRRAGSDPNPSDSGNQTGLVVSTPRFQLSEQVMGSMGEPLEHGGIIVPGEDDNEVYGDNTEVDRHSSRCERQGSQEQSA